VSLDLAAAAKRLLASEGTASATTADRIAHASERLTIHLSRLVGLLGIQALFRRSLVISTRTFPWLADVTRTVASEEPFEDLRTHMAKQSPEVATDAFVLILSTFVGLLGRLIGEELVFRLLHEVWPAVFPMKKES
jgi:hypothetical protein